jgi:DNA-binding MarR family transcriptional regulator
VARERRKKAATGEPDQTRLTYLVTRLQWVLRYQLDEITQPFGITPKQYTALSVLASRPGMSSATLARFTNVTPQASNEMVTLLERKGFLTRSVDHHDARRLEMTLTRAGRKALAKCDAQLDELEAEVFDHLTSREQAALRAMLRSCLDMANRTATRAEQSLASSER